MVKWGVPPGVGSSHPRGNDFQLAETSSTPVIALGIPKNNGY